MDGWLDLFVRGLPEWRACLLDRSGRPGIQAVGARLGRIESDVAAAPERCFRFDGPRATLATGEGVWDAGVFEVPTLGDLRRRVRDARGSAGHRLRLSAMHGIDPITDVATLQATAPDGALFQVASQLNGLEAIGPFVSPIADYLNDGTQGPRAAVSAFPGTFLRHYRAPAPGGSRFVQTTDGRQLDFLADAVPAAVARVESGYLTDSGVADFDGLIESLTAHHDRIRLGVHDGIEVVLGHDWDGPVREPRPRIAQVFTSTAALGYSGIGVARLAPACRPLLRAAYLGTLLAALALGKRACVLTLIGGGVFANPLGEIWEAILWAMEETERSASAPLEVIVNVRAFGAGLTREVALGSIRRHGGGVLVEVSEGVISVGR